MLIIVLFYLVILTSYKYFILTKTFDKDISYNNKNQFFLIIQTLNYLVF